MANEFKHVSVGTELTQTEYESIGGHVLDSQAIGDIIYASSTSQLRRLGIGSTGAVLTVTGGIPAWDTTWTPTGHLIPASDDTYDLGSASAAWQDLFLEGDISLTDAGSISTAAGALTIGSAAAINITPTAGSAILLDGTISIDAGVVTGATSITSTAFVGDITGDVTGNADTATLATTVTATANNSTDETVFPTFVDGATSAQGIETDTGLTYNPSTGVLTSTSFTGNVTGNVTGNTSGTAATVTSGTQASITTLANVTTVGALDAGSISTNFGAIDNGSSAITTTGLVSAGSLTVTGTTTLNGNLILGDAAADTLALNATITGATPLSFEGATANGFETSFAFTDPTADRTITFADSSLTVNAAADISGTTLASNVVTSSLTAVGTIATGVWQGTAIASGYIAADAITGAKIADDAIGSEHIADDAVVTAAIADNAITNALMADNAIDSAELAAGSVDTAHIADNQVTLAKMAGIARGKIIYGDASGNPAVLASGTANQVLTMTDGDDFDWADAAGGGGGLDHASQFRLTTGFTGTAVPIASNWEEVDTDGYDQLGTAVTQSSGIFTFPATGIYYVTWECDVWSDGQGGQTAAAVGELQTSVNAGSGDDYSSASRWRTSLHASYASQSASCSFIFDVTNTTTHKVRACIGTNAVTVNGDSGENRNALTFIKLGDT